MSMSEETRGMDATQAILYELYCKEVVEYSDWNLARSIERFKQEVAQNPNDSYILAVLKVAQAEWLRRYPAKQE